MIYNYSRLQLNFNYLQKYDLLDKKLVFQNVNFICTYFTQLKPANVEKLAFLSNLLTQEWFCGQKLIIQDYFLFHTYNKKEIHFKITLRKSNFWNLLDLCMNSIFIHEVQTLPKTVLYFEKIPYLNNFSFNLWKNNFLFPRLKEDYLLIYQLKYKPSVSSINFRLN